ncbi:hypothetical protein DFH08DRAFT_442612 [Mycena albidolilacea]|uniref:Uncharacterized protein n=1 Tax=Mycena albidolilacea TaxID=1033008 RepID=A0AAD7AH01_9AGAR|nr:hypothetical protein DFH08DRAFT_442612 [Mycena albidolilacea]
MQNQEVVLLISSYHSAKIEFGRFVPDITHAWMAQASSIHSKFESSDAFEVSGFYIRTYTGLRLDWEMSLNAEATPDAILDNLPEKIHVFVQVPLVHEEHIEEPKIYWSTDPNVTTTALIPPGALTIKMAWMSDMRTAMWESHHYEVAEAALKRYGLDSTTNIAQVLDLPMLEVPSDGREPEPVSWFGYYAKDPHTWEEVEKTLYW